MKKSVVRILCFIFLLSGVLWCANRVLAFKHGDGIYSMAKFYQQKENTVDVLVMGSSRAFENVNTGLLWEEYGIAAYDLCGSLQPVWNTYYYLKEALKTQKPKLIVLETYMFSEGDEYADDSRIIKNTFGMKWSRDKIEAIKTSAPRERWKEFLFGYVWYHSRYAELSREDFFRDKGDVYYKDWKGFGCNMDTRVFDRPDTTVTDGRWNVLDKTRDYFQRFMELAEENDIPVLMFVAPYAGITEHEKEVFNTVSDMAAEYGVDFINYNLMYDQLGMDFSQDAADVFHLNYRGNQKLTRALGDYIVSHYSVPDRRGDEDYASWEGNARYISAQIGNQLLKETAELSRMTEQLKNPDYLLVVTVDGTCTTADENLEDLWTALGISQEIGSGIWCIDNSKGPLYISGEGISSQYIRMDYHDISMERTWEADSGSWQNTVSVDRREYRKTDNGVNVLVYSKVTQEVADVFGIRTEEDYALVR